MLDTSTYFAFPIHPFCSLFHPFCFPKNSFLYTVFVVIKAPEKNNSNPVWRLNYNGKIALDRDWRQIKVALTKYVASRSLPFLPKVCFLYGLLFGRGGGRGSVVLS